MVYTLYMKAEPTSAALPGHWERPVNNSISRYALVSSCVLGLSACGTLYKLDVDANHQADALPGKTYVVLSADPSLDVKSAEFGQYAGQLERALQPHGYTRVANDAVADAALGVYISAGVGDARKSYHTVNRAIYETQDRSGGAGVAARNADQRQQQGGKSVGGPTSLDRTPEQQLSGYEKNAFATTVYTKHLSVMAVDLQQYLNDIQTNGRDKAVPQELWSVDVETTGSPESLARVMPVMIAASQPFLGTGVDDNVQVSLSEGDRRVRSIKGK